MYSSHMSRMKETVVIGPGILSIRACNYPTLLPPRFSASPPSTRCRMKVSGPGRRNDSRSLAWRGSTAIAASSNNDPIVQITVNDAAKKLADGGWIYLDVRTAEEYAQQHVEGSIHVPVLIMGPNGMEPNPDFVLQVTKAIPPGAGTRILVGCRSGMRSQTAIRLLDDEVDPDAYETMLNVDTGIIGWIEASLPVVQL